jgi:hypothetical protein
MEENYVCKRDFSYLVNKISYTWPLIIFSVIINIYYKKTKGPTLMELFTATEKQKTFFDN